MAQSVSAPGLGPGGRRFESCHPDTIVKAMHLQWLFFASFYSDFLQKKYKGRPVMMARIPFQYVIDSAPGNSVLSCIHDSIANMIPKAERRSQSSLR